MALGPLPGGWRQSFLASGGFIVAGHENGSDGCRIGPRAAWSALELPAGAAGMSGGLDYQPRQSCSIDNQMVPGPRPAPPHHEITIYGCRSRRTGCSGEAIRAGEQ
jgi:hypothetical protein